MTFISIWVNSMSWTCSGKEKGKSLSYFGQALAQVALGTLQGFNRNGDVAAGDSGSAGERLGSEGSSHLNNSMVAILRQTQAASTTREAARRNQWSPCCPLSGTSSRKHPHKKLSTGSCTSRSDSP